jgi:cytochrome c
MKVPHGFAILFAASAAFAGAAAHASAQLATQAGCAACHAVDKKMLGPSYKDIAARYKGKAEAVTLLSARVRAGGKGVWGEVPMPPTDAANISDADLKAVVSWLLKTPS